MNGGSVAPGEPCDEREIGRGEQPDAVGVLPIDPLEACGEHQSHAGSTLGDDVTARPQHDPQALGAADVDPAGELVRHHAAGAVFIASYAVAWAYLVGLTDPAQWAVLLAIGFGVLFALIVLKPALRDRPELWLQTVGVVAVLFAVPVRIGLAGEARWKMKSSAPSTKRWVSGRMVR